MLLDYADRLYLALANGSEDDELGYWRRGRDLNPRYGFRPYNGLANRRLQPLGHLSVP